MENWRDIYLEKRVSAREALLSVKSGDRVAFITQGRWPRAMCGIVISASSKDRRGRRCHRVLTSGKIYLARPNAIRRLVLKRF